MISAQAAKFLIVGISNTAISYTVFIIFFYFITNENAITSQLFSYTSGILWSFYWNNKWTFDRSNCNKEDFIKFASTQLFLLLLSTVLMHLAATYIQYNLMITWLVVMANITILNFLCSKYLVFKQ